MGFFTHDGTSESHHPIGTTEPGGRSQFTFEDMILDYVGLSFTVSFLKQMCFLHLLKLFCRKSSLHLHFSCDVHAKQSTLGTQVARDAQPLEKEAA